MHISEKCCYFALAFEEETNRKAGKKVLRKVFLKKVRQKFGSFKNVPYLCTTFASTKSRNGPKGSWKKFWKKFAKNLVVSKKCLTFAPLSRQQNRKMKDAKKDWRYRGRKPESIKFFEDIEQQSFYLLSQERISKQYLWD